MRILVVEDEPAVAAAVGAALKAEGYAGSVAGLIVGGLVGATLLQTLAGLFDPPAKLAAIPFSEIAGLIVAVALGLFGAVLVASRALGRLGVLSALRER